MTHCGMVWHRGVHKTLGASYISECTALPQVHKAAHDKLSDTCEGHMEEETHKFHHMILQSGNKESAASSINKKNYKIDK